MNTETTEQQWQDHATLAQLANAANAISDGKVATMRSQRALYEDVTTRACIEHNLPGEADMACVFANYATPTEKVRYTNMTHTIAILKQAEGPAWRLYEDIEDAQS